MFADADLLIVGAGFYGATIAERAAAAGRRVVVIDKRGHIGGNAYSEIDPQTGIEVHRYGAHLFHTSSQDVWDYISRFTRFTSYQHRVFVNRKNVVYTMPINLGTICQFFGRALSPSEARDLVSAQAAEIDGPPRNMEEKAIALIGRPLYEAFIYGYSKKQWQKEPCELPETIITRLPVRYNFDNRYFNDRFEGLPVDGYTPIFEKMLRSEQIRLELNTDFFEIRAQLRPDQKIIYTGPIDRFYDYSEGTLGWRTTDFDYERPRVRDFQGTSVMNYADVETPWTRIIEFRHFHPEREQAPDQTLIAREFSRAAGVQDEPYYPIGTESDRTIYDRYRARARGEPHTRFGGRLGTYRYLDMHQAIGAALRDYPAIDGWLADTPNHGPGVTEPR